MPSIGVSVSRKIIFEDEYIILVLYISLVFLWELSRLSIMMLGRKRREMERIWEKTIELSYSGKKVL
jgi:hypothetical protein